MCSLKTGCFVLLTLVFVARPATGKQTWADAMAAAREATTKTPRQSAPPANPWQQIKKDYPLESDWLLQDLGAIGGHLSANRIETYPARWFTAAAEGDIQRRMVLNVMNELGPRGSVFQTELARLEKGPPTTRAWLDLYVKACRLRREARLGSMTARCRSFVFTKHYNMGGSHYAYTENQTDGHTEWNFLPGSALCLLEMDGPEPRVRMLLEDAGGVIRDTDVSYDGRRVLFAWKKSRDEDDYHLYEMELEGKGGQSPFVRSTLRAVPANGTQRVPGPLFPSGKVRQLTFGRGIADYEGAYLPNGDIVFNSTRCVQVVDCFTTQVSNLYTCDRDGKYLRRLAFDQVHTNYPAVTEDGRVLYTRWEYNDRGQIFPQALFQMNPDGTGQTAFYGNNSWFPTTVLHARNIFGTRKVLAIATGHHTRQFGKLIVIDPAKGREENAGVQLVAPPRETPADRTDRYGQEGELFQYPYPLSESEYLVAYSPWGLARAPLLFGIYYMTRDGRRELLAADPRVSCNQPVPLDRPAPRHVRPNMVDYRQTSGAYYLQDIYAGPGLAGIARGTVKKLRVIALDFRPALVGGNHNHGVAGSAFVATPVSVSQGCWDTKRVLGEAAVGLDGSAFFSVPACTPVYFQAIDAKGRMVQTMRSWSTVQPGETAACGGCHESKNAAPAIYAAARALRGGPKALLPFYGPARGFSFPKEIQPILDARCVCCHNDRSKLAWLSDEARRQTPAAAAAGADRSFSLLGDETIDVAARRRWSDAFLVLTNAEPMKRKSRLADYGDVANLAGGVISGWANEFVGRSGPLVNWISPQSAPPMLPPYAAGSSQSRLMTLLEQGHKGVQLSREELDKIACWIDLVVPYCGDYEEANAWTPEEKQRHDYYTAKRKKLAELERENIAELLRDRAGIKGYP